jgi:hypothetical protein
MVAIHINIAPDHQPGGRAAQILASLQTSG